MHPVIRAMADQKQKTHTLLLQATRFLSFHDTTKHCQSHSGIFAPLPQKYRRIRMTQRCLRRPFPAAGRAEVAISCVRLRDEAAQTNANGRASPFHFCSEAAKMKEEERFFRPAGGAQALAA